MVRHHFSSSASCEPSLTGRKSRGQLMSSILCFQPEVIRNARTVFPSLAAYRSLRFHSLCRECLIDKAAIIEFLDQGVRR
jgi:hypothetical protein